MMKTLQSGHGIKPANRYADRLDLNPEEFALALLAIQQQESLAGVLAATIDAARRLATPCYLGSLLRDQSSSMWYLTALLDPAAQPVLLARLSVGPFPLALPPPGEPVPLGTVFGQAWGADGCAMVERWLGTAAALCEPIPDERGPRGALVALLPAPQQSRLLATVLGHATSAAGRLFLQQPPGDDRVLDADIFAHRAESEILRAVRFQRPLAVALLDLDPASTASIALRVAQQLRPWDVIGIRGNSLVVLVPETTRAGVTQLLQRLGELNPGRSAGGAMLFEDGHTLAELLRAAAARATPVTALSDPEGAAVMQPGIWTQGAPAGPQRNTVRCPRCLTAYTWRATAGSSATAYEERSAAVREQLQTDCPAHPARLSPEYGLAPRGDERRRSRLAVIWRAWSRGGAPSRQSTPPVRKRS